MDANPREVKLTRQPALLLDQAYIAVKREDLERWHNWFSTDLDEAAVDGLSGRCAVLRAMIRKIESYLKSSP